MIGHEAHSVIIHRLRGAQADKRFIEGVSKLKCNDCAQTSTEIPTHPVAAPSFHSFNYEVQVDILEEKDFVGERHSVLSNVCNGTTYHMVFCRASWRKQVVLSQMSPDIHNIGRTWLVGHLL